MSAPLPANERPRLAALRALDILDTPPEPAFDDVACLAAQICGAPIAAVSLIDENRQWFKAITGLDASETSRDAAFCAYTILQDAPLVVTDTRADARFADNPFVKGDPNIRFYAGAPLCTPDGHALGSLCVVDRTPRTLSPAQTFALEVLSRQVSAELELRRCCRALQGHKARLEMLATTDGLTGLKNHRAFQERLGEEVSRATRYGTALSLVMVDVDHFKRFNDAFGHPAGDARLQLLAKILRRAVRDCDVAARYGGEEFALILPQTGSGGALSLAERLRQTVETGPWPDAPMTISAGLSSLRPGATGAALTAAADRALYEAKRRGRNRVTIAACS